jgi:molecular chaperone GrpE
MREEEGRAAEDQQAPAPGQDRQEEGSGLEDMEATVAELQDRWMRTAAEFENYKKRRERETADLLRYATEPLVRELLPILDSFERAIGAGQGQRDYQALHDGVELIRSQLREALRRVGVERQEPAGEPFDPHRHEAVSMLPHEEVPADHVAEVLQPGYTLNERVIRPARVVVSSGGHQEPPPEED